MDIFCKTSESDFKKATVKHPDEPNPVPDGTSAKEFTSIGLSGESEYSSIVSFIVYFEYHEHYLLLQTLNTLIKSY